MVQELSEKAKLFAQYYVIDFNKSNAAEKAGYANVHDANELLRDPRVQAEIKDAKYRASEHVNISVAYVLEKFRRIAESSPLDYFDIGADGRPRLDLTDLTDEQRDALKSLKFTKEGPQIETHDKVAALSHLAKFFGISTDKIEVTGANGGPVASVNSAMSVKELTEIYSKIAKGEK